MSAPTRGLSLMAPEKRGPRLWRAWLMETYRSYPSGINEKGSVKISSVS